MMALFEERVGEGESALKSNQIKQPKSALLTEHDLKSALPKQQTY